MENPNYNAVRTAKGLFERELEVFLQRQVIEFERKIELKITEINVDVSGAVKVKVVIQTQITAEDILHSKDFVKYDKRYFSIN
jgi:hypothetical protein